MNRNRLITAGRVFPFGKSNYKFPYCDDEEFYCDQIDNKDPHIDFGDSHWISSKINMGSEKSPTCLQPRKKNPGKVPKRINKAEREKRKREHLNELFLELASALEVTEQNSGKASVLSETTRVVKDMLDHIRSLKKEHAALLTESQYVMVERKELRDETCSLQNQINELKSVIKERSGHTNLDLNAPAVESQEPQYFQQDIIRLAAGDPLLYVIPASHNVQLHPLPDAGNKPMSSVSKPCPRYPIPSDSWPFQLLKEVGKESNK